MPVAARTGFVGNRTVRESPPFTLTEEIGWSRVPGILAFSDNRNQGRTAMGARAAGRFDRWAGRVV